MKIRGSIMAAGARLGRHLNPPVGRIPVGCPGGGHVRKHYRRRRQWNQLCWPLPPVRLHEEVIMNRIRRICCCLAGLPRRADVLLTSAAAAPAVLATSPPAGLHTDRCSAGGGLSFQRIVDIPFDACLAALDNWQRAGHDGEPHPGQGLWRGPIERDRDSGTCSIQVRVARGPLRPPLLMRLDIDRWSSSRTALELIPHQRARPTAGYFRAGHRLLDSLTHALPAGTRNAPRTTSARSRPGRSPAAAARARSTCSQLTAAPCNATAHAAPSRQQMQSRTCADSVPGESRAVI